MVKDYNHVCAVAGSTWVTTFDISSSSWYVEYYPDFSCKQSKIEVLINLVPVRSNVQIRDKYHPKIILWFSYDFCKDSRANAALSSYIIISKGINSSVSNPHCSQYYWSQLLAPFRSIWSGLYTGFINVYAICTLFYRIWFNSIKTAEVNNLHQRLA